MASDPTPQSDGLGGRRRAWLLVVFTLLVGAAFPYLASLMNANERPRILQAIALVDAGELRVDGRGARGIDPGIDVARSPVDEHLYPNKPPGATVAAVVGYAGLKLASDAVSLRDVTRIARLIGGVLPTILLAWFLLRRAEAEGRSRWMVAALTLWIVATPAASYGRLLFGPPLTACLLTIGLTLIVDAHERRARPLAAAGGALAGAAVTVEYLAVFAALPLGVWVLVRWWRDRDHARLLATVGGAVVPIVGLAAYHTAVFGGPLATGYHHVTDPDFAQTHAQGLLGLGLPTTTSLYEHLLSPWGGLLYWAPLWGLALVFAVRAWAELSTSGRLGVAIFATLLVVNLGLAQTGGWRVGPRYLVGFFPLLLPGVIVLLQRASERAVLAVAVLALAVFSTFANMLAAMLFPQLIPVGNPLGDLLVPLWLDGHAPYNWLGPMVGPRGGLHVLLVLAFATLAWSLARLPWPVWRWRAFALGGLGGVVLVAAALAVEAAPDAEANLSAIERIWEPSPTRPRITIEIRPLG